MLEAGHGLATPTIAFETQRIEEYLEIYKFTFLANNVLHLDTVKVDMVVELLSIIYTTEKLP